jgi:hypothetical protein
LGSETAVFDQTWKPDDLVKVKWQDFMAHVEQLGERFQSSNHMGCLKRPHSVDGKPKMQLSGFMESVV